MITLPAAPNQNPAQGQQANQQQDHTMNGFIAGDYSHFIMAGQNDPPNQHTTSWTGFNFTPGMEVCIPHDQVPADKTCQGITLTNPRCNNKRCCISCNAASCMAERSITQELQNVLNHYLAYIMSHRQEMTNMDPRAIFQIIVQHLLDIGPQHRKMLSHLGAVRVPLARINQILQTAESLNNYWIHIVATANRPGYIMFHDYGNNIMGSFVEQIQIEALGQYNAENKADFIEAALALSWIAAVGTRETREVLTEVMHMVSWIENGLDALYTAQNGTFPVRNWRIGNVPFWAV